MGATSTLSNREARWLAIAAQGLGTSRTATAPSRRRLGATVAALGTVQLDAINVVERTQLLVLFSRLGAYDRRRFDALTGPRGELVEYWGHAASLIPAVHEPLLRWRKAEFRGEGEPSARQRRWRAWEHEHADYLAAILDEVRDRGPLAASQLSDPRRRDGEWWDRRSLGRQAMELLFAEGRLVGWRTPGFERVYDLPERGLPEAVLATPTPDPDEAHRQLLLISARAHGVGTVSDLADYFRLKNRVAKARIAELVEAGELVQVAVEGWKDPAYVLAGARPRRPRRQHATLLSPFDSLIWERARTSRLFGYDFRIEVYTPAARRTFGYYVLSLLLGDELVGRLDLKADRRASALLVQAAHAEAGADAEAAASGAAGELRALAGWLGLDDVTVVGRGELAPALASAMAHA